MLKSPLLMVRSTLLLVKSPRLVLHHPTHPMTPGHAARAPGDAVASNPSVDLLLARGEAEWEELDILFVWYGKIW